MSDLSQETATRLQHDEVVWCATVRSDGSPHLTPVWFVFDRDLFWIGTTKDSIKVKNVTQDERVSLALEDGDRPVVAEGRATVLLPDFPDNVVTMFTRKYGGWDIRLEEPHGPRALLRVTVCRWLYAGQPR